MRLLYITPSFQHPAMRGPTRCYYFIKELSRRHEITLLTLSQAKVPAAALEEMASYTRRILLFHTNGAFHSHAERIFGNLPLYGRRFRQLLQLRAGVKQMKEAFAKLVREESYDLVLFHGKDLFPVIEESNGLPLVVDFCDATSLRVLSRMRYASVVKLPLLALRYFQVRQIEKKLVQKSAHIAFVSCRDREAVLDPNREAKVIPIGVDHQYWKRSSPYRESNCIVFTGVMNYAPNADAAGYLVDKILPVVRQSIPNLEVFIVGRDPSPALNQKVKNCPDVTVTGFVDDVRPYLERATVCAAPLRFGSGVQNKILEAMAMEVPVVTTSIGAAGLRVDGAGKPPALVADGEKQFAACLVSLLQNEAERTRLAREGRQFVEHHFVWSRSAENLEKMCQAAALLNKQDHPKTS